MSSSTPQSLRFGPIELDATEGKPAHYFISGRKLYAIGTTTGMIEPVGAEHLIGEMGGVWAHPVKFLDGWFFAAEDSTGRNDWLHCTQFEGHLSDVALHFAHGPLQITRTDFVVDDETALFSLVEVVNNSENAWSGRLDIVVQVNIQPSWFSGWECGGLELMQDRGLVVGYDKLWQGKWGVVFGSSLRPIEIIFSQQERFTRATLRYELTVQSGERVPLEFLVACDHQNGHHGALQLFGTLIGRGHNLLNQKRERYRKDAFEGVILHTPDQSVNDNWALAKANLLMLEADYEPYLPGYYLAGIPEYPQLFGCDNTYTTPGALAAGFASMMRSTLNVLGDYALRGCGRVPHEVTTNGRVFNPGNTQETPQFAIAVWDYVCWTGDLAFLRMMYPICREGVLEYLPSLWGGHEDGYPTGDAMVERHGMGSRKLDSACYLYAAWRALAEMARVLQRPEASEYERRAAEWLERFEQDWWMADEGLYADSLHTDYRPQLDGHWTQVVPLQLGITQPSRAEGVLDRVEQEFTNEWGLVHTRKREERVWTLPTGLLILAQLRHGRTKHALQFLDNIALTARYGMLGAFKELIPEGLCFVQLWSAGLYIQCVVEGVLGIQPLAHEHTVRIVPTLPDTWPEATISGLPIGEHLLNITVGKDACRVEHRSGSQPLRVQFTARGTTVAAIRCAESVQNNVSLENGALVFSVDVGQNVQLQANGGTAYLTYNQL
jgi:hypothetical protein